MEQFRGAPLRQISTLICVVLLIAVAYLSFGFPWQERQNSKCTQVGLRVLGSATSGRIFKAEKTRSYVRSIDIPKGSQAQSSSFTNMIKDGRCKKWCVVTTIFPQSEGITSYSTLTDDWCMVVVGDKKSPAGATYTFDSKMPIIYLDVKSQSQLAARSDFVNELPWNHFGRKNVGYLYAIANGANMIWDFDDDNFLTYQIKGQLALPDYTGHKYMSIRDAVNFDFPTFNPLPVMGPNQSLTMWPRGFPLQDINNPVTRVSLFDLKVIQVPTKSIGVIQSLANNDPDVDAVYRLTRSLPVMFNTPFDEPVAVPQKSLSPFNAQATMFFKDAFWMLYLPITVHGRVSDIWRSYIGERLANLTNHKILFHKPIVTQYRNSHNYIGDFDSEKDLYLKSFALTRFLYTWAPKGRTLPDCMKELWIELYERQFIEETDIRMLLLWITELQKINYTFPPVLI